MAGPGVGHRPAGQGQQSAVDVPGDPEEMERALRRATHTTIAAVTEDYEALHFNTAISKLMELTNAVIRAREAGHGDHQAYADAVDTLLLLLAPVAPHIAERLWEVRGHPYSVHQQPWPVADPALAASDTIELPVQVDGKLRDRLVVTVDTPPEEIEHMALASVHVQRDLAGRAPMRVIIDPGKLVNVVTPKGLDYLYCLAYARIYAMASTCRWAKVRTSSRRTNRRSSNGPIRVGVEACSPASICPGVECPDAGGFGRSCSPSPTSPPARQASNVAP